VPFIQKNEVDLESEIKREELLILTDGMNIDESCSFILSILRGKWFGVPYP